MTTTTRQQIIIGLRTAIISIAITALTFAVHFQYFSRLPLLVPVNNRIKYSSSAASADSIAAQPNSSSSGIMTAEFLKDDYRAFIFATHPLYGILLLRCTRKKNKGPHFQAPGGHIDKEDFERAESITQDDSNQGRDILMQACKIGAARELFEETGMDIRSELDRLQPARLWDSSKDSLMNVLKFRLFFKLRLEDSDFAAGDIESKISLGLFQSMDTSPPHLMLKLSHEHQGWRFEADAMKAVDLLVDHSGGKVSKALEMAIGQGEIYDAKGELDIANFVEKYVKDDYRAFIFATHPLYGILLLHCTRKKKKGSHFQAPGGHIDKEDFEDAVSNMQGDSNQGPAILMQACKIGAARELFEETGMDVRSELDRLQPVRIWDSSKDSLENELKFRLFFKLCLKDDDFVNRDIDASVKGVFHAMNRKPPHLMLRLSREHQGFVFEPDAKKAVNMLVAHSGGKISEALEMAINQGEIDDGKGEVGITDKVEGIFDESKIVGKPIERGTDEPDRKCRFLHCLNCC